MSLNMLRHFNLLKKATPYLSMVRSKAAYEGDGKTTVKVLNHDFEYGLMIDSYSTFGFKLNNGLTVLGPMAIFSRAVLSWQVDGSHNITKESLRLFKLLEPDIDLLVIGLDFNDREIMNKIFQLSRKAGLNVEILPVEHACSTFNFLNSESRSVAAALLPPLLIKNMNEDDMLATKAHYKDIFNSGDSI